MKLISILTIVFCILFTAAGLRAQNHDGTGGKPTVAGQSDDFYPVRWKNFEYADQGFKIRLPAKPTEKKNAPSDPVLASTDYDYDGVFYATLNISKFTVDFEKMGLVDQVLASGRDGAVSKVKDEEPMVTKEQDFTVQGHKGRFVKMELKSGIVLRMKYIVARDKLYVIVVSTPKPKPGDPGAEDSYEKITMAVIDSFQLI